MNFFLGRLLEPVSLGAGESGYFSTPSDALDPHLFEAGTDHIRPEIRRWILDRLYSFWKTRYHNPEDWSRVWIAGSGISYQWSASRGNGDLDILIGVDFVQFWQDNPRYHGLSEQDVAEIFNQEFHAELWPETAEVEFSSTRDGDLKQSYEVTFYVNPNSTDIRDIKPYAAYDLTGDTWTVRPPSGEDFNHPKEFYDYAEEEARHARDLVERFNTHINQARGEKPGTPRWYNSVRQVDLLASQASDLFDSIHLGRKNAFNPGGSGYGDYHNFRWQYHKQQGTAQALNAVRKAHLTAHQEFNERLYGGPIDAADVALRRAALWNRGGR